MAARPGRGAAGAGPGAAPQAGRRPERRRPPRGLAGGGRRRRRPGSRSRASSSTARGRATRPTPSRRWRATSPGRGCGSCSAPTSWPACRAGASRSGSWPPPAWRWCRAPADDERALAAEIAPGRADILDVPEIGVSSSMIRDRIAAGRPIRFLVPPAVEESLRREGLVTSPRISPGDERTTRDLARADPGRRRRRGVEERQGHRDPRHAGPGGLHGLPRWSATGQTPRQTKAIAEEIRLQLKDRHGARARKIEGEREGEWILVDLLDLVVHVFTPEARDFYRLDRLWSEAPQQAVRRHGLVAAAGSSA